TRERAGPFGQTESNEENARSIVGCDSHGTFSYHFGGDLTGGGVPGIPDVETLLAGHELHAHRGPQGVDVAHAHHHARRTSSNGAQVDALAPKDGRYRNVVAGMHAAYVGSPQRDVLSAWLDGDRLGQAYFWVPDRAISGETHERLVDA